MHGKRVGLWLIGAKGGVATTVITGLSALKRGTTGNAGLLTQTESFQKLGLVEFDQIVVGGHDIRPGSLADEARRMWSESRAITPDHLDGAQDDFEAISHRLRPGTVVALSHGSLQEGHSRPTEISDIARRIERRATE